MALDTDRGRMIVERWISDINMQPAKMGLLLSSFDVTAPDPANPVQLGRQRWACRILTASTGRQDVQNSAMHLDMRFSTQPTTK